MKNKQLISFLESQKFEYIWLFGYYTNIYKKRYNQLVSGTELATIDELKKIAIYFCVDVESLRDN